MNTSFKRGGEDLKKILKQFADFIVLCENSTWMLSANSETTIKAFESASFIEKAMQFLSNDFRSLEMFREFLTQELQSRHIQEKYPDSFFAQACDQLLTFFVQKSELNIEILNVAIRIYISICSKERLENVLTNSILYAQSVKFIFNHILEKFNQKNDDKDLVAEMLLENWIHELRVGKSVALRNKIENIIESLNDFDLLLRVAALKNLTEDRKTIAMFIINKLIENLNSYHNENQSLWLHLLADQNIFISLCKNYEALFDEFCNFYVFFKSNSNSRIIYPDIDIAKVAPIVFDDCTLRSRLDMKLEKNSEWNDFFL